MTVDEIDHQLDSVCRSIAHNDDESAMTQDFALQLLGNLGALDEDTRRNYVRRLRSMARDEYDWPET